MGERGLYSVCASGSMLDVQCWMFDVQVTTALNIEHSTSNIERRSKDEGEVMKKLWIMLIVLGFSACAEAGPKAEQKKLIEFGWDEPSTEFLRAHIAEMEKTPFDGVVFVAPWKKPGGG